MIRRRFPHLRNLLFLLVLPLVFACAGSGQVRHPAPAGDLAVAPFHQPQREWVPEEFRNEAPRRELPDRVLEGLTEELLAQLRQRGRTPKVAPGAVERCREILLARGKASSESARRYWAGVGRCLSADTLLVPQLVDWRQREGGRWGVERPAMVALRLVWLDPDEEKILRAFSFDEEQKSLAENLLDIGSFLRRGGHWITAEELAAEGIRRGLEDMGL